MKNVSFLGFLGVVLTIYSFLNYYIIRRGWQAFKGLGWVQGVYLAIMICLALSYPTLRFLPRSCREQLPAGAIIPGAVYLGMMFYLFILLLMGDLVRLFFGLGRRLFFPSFSWLRPGSPFFRLSFLTALGISMLIVFIGFLNSKHPRLRSVVVYINKALPADKPTRIVAASDLHLGSIIGLSRLRKIVNMINSVEPDLLLLPGDMMDEAVTERLAKEAAAVFREMKAGLGIIAVPGNHETYSRQENRLQEITQGHIRVLQDEVVVLNGLVVVGRRDRAIEGFGQKRVPLENLLDSVNRTFPVLLLDHQPFHLEEAEEAGVDLQVSGHTHAGQLFPLNFVNRRLYEKNWGYHRRRQTHYYISSGVGTWGPPVQTAARPEIVLITLSSSLNQKPPLDANHRKRETAN